MSRFITVHAVHSREHLGTPARFQEVMVNVDKIVSIQGELERIYRIDLGTHDIYAVFDEDILKEKLRLTPWYKRLLRW